MNYLKRGWQAHIDVVVTLIGIALYIIAAMTGLGDGAYLISLVMTLAGSSWTWLGLIQRWKYND